MRQTAFGRDIRASFEEGNALKQLLIVNVSVFVFLLVLQVIFLFAGLAKQDTSLFTEIVSWISMPYEPKQLLFQPYSLLTYAFVHTGILHFIFNMLALYLFGRLFVQFIGDRKLWPLYIAGAMISGMISFLLMQILFFQYGANSSLILMGASGSVMAIIFTVGFMYPNLPMHLIIFGTVRLKYIIAGYLLLELFYIAAERNLGGGFAHIGGAGFGALYGYTLQKGNDPLRWLARFIDKIRHFFQPKGSRLKVTYRRPVTDEEYNELKIQRDATLDELLDKILEKGMSSLSKREKELLKKYSERK